MNEEEYLEAKERLKMLDEEYGLAELEMIFLEAEIETLEKKIDEYESSLE